MAELSQLFILKVSNDQMIAELHYTDEYLMHQELNVTKEEFTQFLHNNKIIFGLDEGSIEKVVSGGVPLEDFPMVIARGIEPIPGLDGKVQYTINFNPMIEKDLNDDRWDFREVMRIPSVEVNQMLAKLILPTEGTDGTNVYGNLVRSKPGKPIRMKAGKNVRFEEKSLTFYSESVGQANVQGNTIHVHPVYEVSDSLSMKEGNIDFIGTVIIKGDVPSGYTIKAGGDIKIYGMVEAATVKAEGSVYVAEGLAGQQKGTIEAGETIQIGYINQGNVYATNKLFVENSILHSECIAGDEIICQRGSVIGGHSSAGNSIQIKHVGNHMNTRTELILGQNHKELQETEELQSQKKEIEDTLKKLAVLGEKLSQVPNIESNPKLFQALQRQKASYDKNVELLDSIKEKLESLNHETNEKYAKLIVIGNIFANTVVAFGKYKRMIDTSYKKVQFELVRNEIYMRSLEDSFA
ncbi:DUF342 domain-containing protein [Ornithinibacillus bavariensis]|uniref:DUF342 domain-containing protein n=1 Tax=Ornithinibacillus bavariensis TaxID=545502 RepID=UPI000EDD9521|nr:hypothetical protein [Ornithinibacillus sp.]